MCAWSLSDATPAAAESVLMLPRLHATVAFIASGPPPGIAGLVRGEWIRPGAVVIDAGYSHGKGNVDFEGAVERASLITPVPGSVGPMTIATLLDQTVQAWRTHV